MLVVSPITEDCVYCIKRTEPEGPIPCLGEASSQTRHPNKLLIPKNSSCKMLEQPQEKSYNIHIYNRLYFM
jgi:hypothetical protein